MINNKSVLAIIPARGGSKGLPRKNVLNLGGMPLIGWTIHAAQRSRYIDRVILSSDDEEICSTARQYHCEVPFVRPAELADDRADSISVMQHAIDQAGDPYDIIVLLQPTSPLRNERHIDEALEQFMECDAASLVSVACLSKSPEWLFFLNEQARTLTKVYTADTVTNRRQDAPKAYYLNGAIYIVDKQYFIRHQRLMDKFTQAYIMDTRSSLDIDTREDFDLAELFTKNDRECDA